jgi:hypothetical protein
VSPLPITWASTSRRSRMGAGCDGGPAGGGGVGGDDDQALRVVGGSGADGGAARGGCRSTRVRRSSVSRIISCPTAAFRRRKVRRTWR